MIPFKIDQTERNPKTEVEKVMFSQEEKREGMAPKPREATPTIWTPENRETLGSDQENRSR